MQTTTVSAAFILATAPVLTEAVTAYCLFCGRPIDSETDTFQHEDGALHLDCAFQGGYDDQVGDGSDLAYDLIKER